MDRTKFLAVLNTLASVYRVTLDALAVEGYWMVLGSLDAARFERAARAELARSRWMPSPAELLEAAHAGPTAAEAWECVLAAIRKHDAYASVDFGPRVNAIVRVMGGWPALCSTLKSETHWRRKEFCDLWPTFAHRDERTLSAEPLRGLATSTDVVRVEIGGLQVPALGEVSQ